MIWALHGTVGMAEDWNAFSSEMGGVRSLDLWRFLEDASVSLEEAGKLITDEISLADTSPVLVGYSMGGRLALHALLGRPRFWKAAIIISAHPGLSGEEDRIRRRKQDTRWSSLARSGVWSEFLRQWEIQGVLGAVDMPGRMLLKDRRVALSRSFGSWSLGSQSDLTNDLHGILCPVLWLTGGGDEKFTRLAESAVSSLPDAEHQVIPNCGHRVPWEKPVEFARACRCFLAAIT